MLYLTQARFDGPLRQPHSQVAKTIEILYENAITYCNMYVSNKAPHHIVKALERSWLFRYYIMTTPYITIISAKSLYVSHGTAIHTHHYSKSLSKRHTAITCYAPVLSNVPWLRGSVASCHCPVRRHVSVSRRSGKVTH